MLKGSLRFAIVVEPKLIHRAVTDRPGVGEIPLLKALIDSGGKSGHVCARSLELSEWQNNVVIVEIVVTAEVLLVVDAVVDLDRELITAFRLYWRRLYRVRARRRIGYQLQQIDGG